MMFITFEGIEGSGKTTQIKLLYDFLIKNGQTAVITREPGGTNIGRQIRAILLNPENNAIKPLTELLLYTADRAQHINEIIKPALDKNKIVLCDRYFDATIAYQGFARGLDSELIKQLHKTVFDDLKPDLTLLLDLEPELGLQRAWDSINNGFRQKNETRFEQEKLSFHKKIRAGYLKLASNEPERFRIIDASQNQACVQQNIVRTLSRKNAIVERS